MTANRTTCPRCKWNLLANNPARNALSRRDNKTYICSGCGMQEALEDSRLIPFWLDGNGPCNMPYWDVRSPVWLVQAEKREDKETGLDVLKAQAEEES